MPFTVRRLDRTRDGGAYVRTRRLFFTADRSRVVEEGDPEAAFLLPKRMSAAEAARYGLTKAQDAPEDKAQKAPENKARGKK